MRFREYHANHVQSVLIQQPRQINARLVLKERTKALLDNHRAFNVPQDTTTRTICQQNVYPAAKALSPPRAQQPANNAQTVQSPNSNSAQQTASAPRGESLLTRLVNFATLGGINLLQGTDPVLLVVVICIHFLARLNAFHARMISS